MFKEYEEFRIQVTVNPTDGQWAVYLSKCPISSSIGPQGPAKPIVTRQQLDQLRQTTDSDYGLLRQIGQAVWQSLMTPKLEPTFEFCLAQAKRDNKGLHVTFVLQHEGAAPPDDSSIRLAELPVELLFKEIHGFIGTSSLTPISRSLQIEPDVAPIEISSPLRILVVVAAPKAIPGVGASTEIEALECALAPLKAENKIVLEFCDPPTKTELFNRLARRDEQYHMLHFIGHGGFGTTGGDPTPQGYISLVRENDNSKAMPLYANDFATFLHDSAVRLVVLTACSTARPASPDELEAAGALADVAQRLMTGPSNLAAVVAMQFDLETDTAPPFTGTFYKCLLDARYTLDEAVTEAREAIITKKTNGHRAWGAPTLYHRCKSGILFTFVESDAATGNGVIALVRNTESPGLVAAVQVTDKQIDILSNYKLIHDKFQELQDHCRPIFMSVRPPVDQKFWDLLETEEPDLQGIIDDLVNHANQVPPSETLDLCIQQLSRIKGHLRNAADQSDIKEITLAVGRLKQVLGRDPAQINIRLVDKAPSLGLTDLVKEMDVAKKKLIHATSEENEQINRDMKRFTELDHGLAVAVFKHNLLQQIDSLLRQSEAFINQDITVLRTYWDDITQLMSKACNKSGVEWGKTLDEKSADLNSALSTNDLAKITRAFRSFCSSLDRSFVQVDTNLLKLCDQLKKIRDVLAFALKIR